MRRIRERKAPQNGFFNFRELDINNRHHSTTNTALKMATAIAENVEEFALSSEVLLRTESFGWEQDWIQLQEDPFGNGGLLSVGVADPDGNHVKEMAKMAEELIDADVDVASIVAKKLEQFRAMGVECLTSGAMEKVMYGIVLDEYKKHREEIDAEIAKEKARAEEARKKEIIAVAVMKKKVQKALDGLFDSPNKEVLQWKLEEMVSTKWPIYSLLAEDKTDNVLVAIARQYANFRDTHKSI